MALLELADSMAPGPPVYRQRGHGPKRKKAHTEVTGLSFSLPAIKPRLPRQSAEQFTAYYSSVNVFSFWPDVNELGLVHSQGPCFPD